MGEYRLVRRAGAGGGGEVWLAEAADGRRVALKVAREGRREALVREAEVSALAVSPALPELLAVGEDRGSAYVALRWIDGEVPERGRTPEATTLAIARDLATALADLHALGFSHGDVKPENVLVDASGRAHLLDLGLVAPVHQVDVRGGTPRYLDLEDESADARARDLLALGATIAELVDASVAAAKAPIHAARRAALPERVSALCAPLLAPSPGARPSATWAADLAASMLGAAGGDASDVDTAQRHARLVRATYLRLRWDELVDAASVAADVAPWLEQAVDTVRRARVLVGAPPKGTRVLGRLAPDAVARWLATLVGSAAASWPLNALLETTEAQLAERLVELARRRPPLSWTLGDLESAVLQAPDAPAPNTARTAAPAPSDVERWTRVAVGLGNAVPDASAIAAVERDPSCPPALAVAAAEALRRSGAAGRALSLLRRSSVAEQPEALAPAADAARRAGELALSEALARNAIERGADPAGRARATLARLCLDAGRADEAAKLVSHGGGAAVAEVAGLVHARSRQTRLALEAVARGEALARDAEERARLAALRGWVLHGHLDAAGADPERALLAYSSAVDHACRAGAIVEEASYRTGEAAAAVAVGDLGTALETARRGALLWEHLGRPEMATRALLARAAAFATAGARHETRAAALDALARARELGDLRAQAYALWAIADVEEPGSAEAQDVVRRSDEILARAPERATDDRVRSWARRLRHLPDPVSRAQLEEVDGLARDESVGGAARLEWWGARASILARAGAERLVADVETVLGALLSLADARVEPGARGPALASGIDLALAVGRAETAHRIASSLSEAARALVARTPAELSASVTALAWISRAHAVPQSSVLDPAQALELERLVASLADRETLRGVLERVVDALVAWTGVERGLLLLPAPDGRLVPRAARNLARRDLDGEQLALSQSLAHRALDERQPVVAVDAAGELSSVHASVHALKLRSVLAVPLLARGQAVGVVYLDDRVRRGAFDDRALAWTRAVASVAAVAIADAQARVLLRRAARQARRASERLADTLAEREAALDVAERELARARAARTTRHTYEDIVGESEALRRMLGVVDRVTQSDVPVLVVGESGSGKELVARAIHSNGPRKTRPFVSENCGAIPEGLLESALFGHVRGAFTGADRPRSGLFEVADRGTLFLDEIGEMSLGMQAKLLRILEDGLVRPVGTERTRKVDVRIIAATNRDLEAMVRDRTFREDLFYRLNIITVRVPALRERPGDVPLVVHALCKKHAAGRAVRVSRAAMERLAAFGWPGNVRQLENEVRRALVLSDGSIELEHLSPEIRDNSGTAAKELGLDVRARVDALEADLVREALERTKGNQTQAAKLLGLSRFGLQKMIKRLGL